VVRGQGEKKTMVRQLLDPSEKPVGSNHWWGTCCTSTISRNSNNEAISPDSEKLKLLALHQKVKSKRSAERDQRKGE